MALADLGLDAVAMILRRSRTGVAKKASRMEVSVKKKSRINVNELSVAMVEVIRRRNSKALCPTCAKRLAAVATSGLCGACHKQVLIEAHYDRLSELEAQREINRIKKAEQRIRDELGIVPKHSRRKQAMQEEPPLQQQERLPNKEGGLRRDSTMRGGAPKHHG